MTDTHTHTHFCISTIVRTLNLVLFIPKPPKAKSEKLILAWLSCLKKKEERMSKCLDSRGTSLHRTFTSQGEDTGKNIVNGVNVSLK